jgi:sterol desaturase/sphingolipid hydroxylase (fatty acid hydroxylase superfamily)
MKFIVAVVILFVVFSEMERRFPLRQQKRFRQGLATDITHIAINQVVVKVGLATAVIPLFLLFNWAINPTLQAEIASQPTWLQFLEAVLIAEFSFYIIHRLAHTLPWLWRFHAIHHSSSELDWLASFRFHPVEMIVTKIFVGIPLVLLGFTRATFGAYLLIHSLQALFNHANVRFRFPILRRLITTPEFHHWHHSQDPDAQNKNFGQPLIDQLFGTIYLPDGKFPSAYGVSEPIPIRYWSQLLFPFRRSQGADRFNHK